MLLNELSAARGLEKADLVLKNATIVNVFTEALQYGDIGITDGMIVGIGEYEGVEEINCAGMYAAPGFIDGHIHLESSLLKPVEFAKAVLPHGTTSVITDPHEISNVCGLEGLNYMLEATEGLPLDVYFMLPSCVPSTSFDESGAVLMAEDLVGYYAQKRVIGLAEMMDYIGTLRGDHDLLQKISHAKQYGKVVDGHAPGLKGKDACGYIAAGIGSDHECVTLEEAMEKLSLGQWIMVREGTAAKNLEALIGLFRPPYYQRAMLVTDDKHPYELQEEGHIDHILRKAIKLGADPCIAIKMATYNTASYFKLAQTGAIAPGYHADIVLMSDLTEVKVEKVFKNGRLVEAIKEPLIHHDILNKIYNSFHCKEIIPDYFKLQTQQDSTASDTFLIIQFIKGEIGTKEIRVPLVEGRPGVSVEQDILKIAAIERHHNTGHIGIGFANGYGLKRGAIASSVAHDSHNIIAIGTNDDDLAIAANCVRDMQGGWAIALKGKVVDNLPLSIAGLMSDLDAATLAGKMAKMKNIARNLGVKEGIDPFMTLAFVSLPVIPELRLITTGLFDVNRQKLVPIVVQSRIE